MACTDGKRGRLRYLRCDVRTLAGIIATLINFASWFVILGS
jgi:hypothetical protein